MVKKIFYIFFILISIKANSQNALLDEIKFEVKEGAGVDVKVVINDDDDDDDEVRVTVGTIDVSVVIISVCEEES